MPEMNGVELANLLRSKNPKLEIILISGFTDNALADMSISSGDYKFLNKPFPIRELRELITSTLA
jgi:FixJ family two-component response regulator